MGIDYEAAIMVGLPREEMEDIVENLEDLIFGDESEVEVCAPYYDGEGDDKAIIGFAYKISDTYRASEIEWNDKDVNLLKAKFKEEFGKEAKIWLSPMGW